MIDPTSTQSGAASETRLLKSALVWLQSLREDKLRSLIIKPLFESKPYHYRKVTDVHNRGEAYHKLDFLLEGSHSVDGVQVKVGHYSNPAAIQNKVLPFAQIALTKVRQSLSNGERRPLSKILWITSGDVDSEAWRAYHDTADTDVIDLWSGDRLVHEIRTHAPHLIPELELLHLTDEAARLANANEWTQAAVRWRDVGIFHLKKFGDRPRALDSFQNAHDCIRAERHPYRYYVSVIRAHIRALASCDVKPARRGTFFAIHPPDDWSVIEQTFWDDIQFITAQLNVLRQHHALRSLSGIQAAVLLQRMGYPTHERLVSNQLRQIKREMQDRLEQGRSVDQGCSLCTGSAVSCLTLGLEHEAAAKAVTWLVSLRQYDYHHRNISDLGLSPNEHAYHYTALAWQGLVDTLGPDDERTLSARDALLGTTPENDPVARWTEFRDQEQLDVLRYVYPVVARWVAFNGALSTVQEANLRESLNRLVQLLHERSRFRANPYVYYPMRENIAGLALAEYFGVESSFRDVLAFVRGRMAFARRHRRLIDSSVERTIGMLESLILYWELALRGK